MKGVAALLREAQALAAAYSPRRAPLVRYRDDPVGYARDVLGVTLWRVQEEVLEALLVPPYRVMVLASHGVGKTFLAALAVSWWFDTRDPSACITTAPNLRQVKDLLWKEVRLQRGRAGRQGFGGPRAPLLWTSSDHFAKGVTSATGEGFQGRHDAELLFVLDEGIGVPAFVYETIDTMFAPTGLHACLGIGNPTDTTSQAYIEATSRDKWRVVQMSGLEHPNVAAELRGQAPPFPAAVRLAQVEEQLRDWCEPVTGTPLATDVLWPPDRACPCCKGTGLVDE